MPSIPHHHDISSTSTTITSQQPNSILSILHKALLHLLTRDLSSLAPLRPLPSLSLSSSHLHPRQDTFFALPASYRGLNDGPTPGAVVGITLGAVAGAMILFWLFSTITGSSSSTSGPAASSSISSEEIIERKKKRRRPRRTERIIVEERRRSIPPGVGTSVASPTVNERIVVEERTTTRTERRVDGDDVVEVIEDESSSTMPSEEPAPRRKKRSSGFRAVDPNAYAGGNFPQQNVYRSGRR